MRVHEKISEPHFQSIVGEINTKPDYSEVRQMLGQLLQGLVPYEAERKVRGQERELDNQKMANQRVVRSVPCIFVGFESAGQNRRVHIEQVPEDDGEDAPLFHNRPREAR